jgi:hypothetical protein
MSKLLVAQFDACKIAFQALQSTESDDIRARADVAFIEKWNRGIAFRTDALGRLQNAEVRAGENSRIDDIHGPLTTSLIALWSLFESTLTWFAWTMSDGDKVYAQIAKDFSWKGLVRATTSKDEGIFVAKIVRASCRDSCGPTLAFLYRTRNALAHDLGCMQLRHVVGTNGLISRIFFKEHGDLERDKKASSSYGCGELSDCPNSSWGTYLENDAIPRLDQLSVALLRLGAETLSATGYLKDVKTILI